MFANNRITKKKNDMKTEIVIWQGNAKVVLHAENEFEKDLIEKIKDSKEGYETKTNVLTDYSYNFHSKHRIEIELREQAT
tara:strand:+ start:270 stop:509 length:240 start_codon:yes stop_codon:yes gene_type:complete